MWLQEQDFEDEVASSSCAWEVYHENSKLRRSDGTIFGRVQAFNETRELKEVIARGLPSYRGKPAVQLPAVQSQAASFDTIVRKRRSAVRFEAGQISLSSLSGILHLSLGKTGTGPDDDGVNWPLRNVPSAGALYPLDVYVVVMAVEGLLPGIYLYRADDHSLGLMSSGEYQSALMECSSLGTRAEQAAVCIVLCGVLGRVAVKYGERGYRFLLLDAGHAGQNLLLAATSQGLASIAVGGFVDDELNGLLSLDGCEVAAVHMVYIGISNSPGGREDILRRGDRV